MKTLRTWAAAALLALTGTAQAALVNLGDGTVKDTNTNLIWLQNWTVNGSQNWSTQRDWALGLDFAGSTDWRLPELSEYAALFEAYGNLYMLPDFSNATSSFYWSSTVFTAAGVACGPFEVCSFRGSTFVRDGLLGAPAVRSADVTADVPEPQTLALVLLAMAATVVARKRR